MYTVKKTDIYSLRKRNKKKLVKETAKEESERSVVNHWYEKP